MVRTGFIARCPFEIGDTIMNDRVGRRNITDILTVHSLKKSNVFFLYEMDGSGRYEALRGSFKRLLGNVFIQVEDETEEKEPYDIKI